MATAGGPRASERAPGPRRHELARPPQLLCPPHLDIQKADHAPDRSRGPDTSCVTYTRVYFIS
jgi:hypothetical protein